MNNFFNMRSSGVIPQGVIDCQMEVARKVKSRVSSFSRKTWRNNLDDAYTIGLNHRWTVLYDKLLAVFSEDHSKRIEEALLRLGR